MRVLHLYRILAIALIAIFLFSGCNKKSEKPVNNTKTVPQSLQKIEEGIDKIISTLDKECKIEETTKKSNTQDNKNEQSGQDKQNESSKSDSKENSSKETDKTSSSSSKKPAITPSPWEEADKTVKEIHKYWNEYHPISIKDGARNEIVDGFDTDLNTLSNSIAGENLMSTLDNSNNLYKYIPEFISNYDSKEVNIKRLKFYVRDVMYKGRFDKWDLALISMKKSSDILVNIKAQSQGKLKEFYETLEYSVKDLEKVTNEKQKSLTQIKGNLILENIKNMEKELKNSKEKQNK